MKTVKLNESQLRHLIKETLNSLDGHPDLQDLAFDIRDQITLALDNDPQLSGIDPSGRDQWVENKVFDLFDELADVIDQMLHPPHH